jgi:hypothetical protein
MNLLKYQRGGEQRFEGTFKNGQQGGGQRFEGTLMMAAWRWTKVRKNLDDDGGGGGQRFKRTFKNGQQGSGQRYKLTFTTTATTGSKEPDFVGDD